MWRNSRSFKPGSTSSATHGTQARVAGRIAREWILADNVDRPPELKTASEKLVAAAYLLQAMPEPSTTLGRNLRYDA